MVKPDWICICSRRLNLLLYLWLVDVHFFYFTRVTIQYQSVNCVEASIIMKVITLNGLASHYASLKTCKVWLSKACYTSHCFYPFLCTLCERRMPFCRMLTVPASRLEIIYSTARFYLFYIYIVIEFYFFLEFHQSTFNTYLGVCEI